MNHQKSIRRQRQRRTFRVRSRISGTAERPRLSISRSHKNIYAQLIDDIAGRTLASASTLDSELKGSVGYGGNKAAAQVVGKALAERALAQGIKEVRFDRGPYRYHGRLAALADAAREAGLQF